jgi:hypothetical protein
MQTLCKRTIEEHPVQRTLVSKEDKPMMDRNVDSSRTRNIAPEGQAKDARSSSGTPAHLMHDDEKAYLRHLYKINNNDNNALAVGVGKIARLVRDGSGAQDLVKNSRNETVKDSKKEINSKKSVNTSMRDSDSVEKPVKNPENKPVKETVINSVNKTQTDPAKDKVHVPRTFWSVRAENRAKSMREATVLPVMVDVTMDTHCSSSHQDSQQDISMEESGKRMFDSASLAVRINPLRTVIRDSEAAKPPPGFMDYDEVDKE